MLLPLPSAQRGREPVFGSARSRNTLRSILVCCRASPLARSHAEIAFDARFPFRRLRRSYWSAKHVSTLLVADQRQLSAGRAGLDFPKPLLECGAPERQAAAHAAVGEEGGTTR